MQHHSLTPCVFWFTGISGSGKSTTASALACSLRESGALVVCLDGDHLREGLNRDLGFDDSSRKENIRRTAEVAKLFYDNGFIVIVSLISPFESDRQAAKDLFPQGAFFEIWMDTDLSICEQRDVKGLYKKARESQITSFTGISSNYEQPIAPHLRLDGSDIQYLSSNIDLLLQLMSRKMECEIKNTFNILLYGYGWAGKSMLEFFTHRNLRGGGAF